MPLGTALKERFIRYASIDTGSDESATTSPSTERQFDLLNLLVSELQELGAADVRLTDYGAVIATIPATTSAVVPAIAFLAHVDTTSAYRTSDVKPIVHAAWDGSDIVLPDDESKVLSPKDWPYLRKKVGDDIITASGRSLLGADDKAGVAIIMEFAKHLLTHPELEHGAIRVCFTPDEEIGRGVHPNLPSDLNVEAAYTLDGSDLGEVVFETFSADKATVTFVGVSTHPGDAKGQMVNALSLAAAFVDSLPQDQQTPETTDGLDGFIHAYHITGGAAETTVELIIRAFELDELAELGNLIKNGAKSIADREPRAKVTTRIDSQYRNMRYWLEKDMRSVDVARAACANLGIEVLSSPIRGGTDGSRLTEMGIPTPNLFTGMQNYHGPLEWVSVQDMEQATDVCIEIAQLWTRIDEQE